MAKVETYERKGKLWERTIVKELNDIDPELGKNWLQIDNKSNPKRVVILKSKGWAPGVKEARKKEREEAKAKRLAKKTQEHTASVNKGRDYRRRISEYKKVASKTLNPADVAAYTNLVTEYERWKLEGKP